MNPAFPAFPAFPVLGAWSDLPRLRLRDFLARFPAVGTPPYDTQGKVHGSDIRQVGRDFEIILISGDVSIPREQCRAMAQALEKDWPLRIAVDGNVQVEDFFSKFFFISGDLYCNALWIGTSWTSYAVGGRAVARDCVFVDADDEGWMLDLPASRIDTPFIFLWNYYPTNIDLNPDAVVFLLGFEASSRRRRVEQRCYAGNEIVHVIDSRFLRPFTCEHTEERVWDCGAIARALAAGECIYREGFDIACEEPMRAAGAAMNGGDFRQAYFLYKQAAAISPRYYPAHMGMANAMAQGGAKAQALTLYVQASALFPPEQTGLVNEALNRGALYALRLGQLDLADELVTQSLEFTLESEWNDQLLAEACWISAEISIAKGETAEAGYFLDEALRYDDDEPRATWMMGLLCYRRGDHEQARAYHARALQRWTGIPYYDVASTYAPPFTSVDVDWDQPDPATVLPA